MRFRSPRELGAIIRQKRRTLGLDQKELARRVGVSRQWIVAVEQGKPRAALGLVLQTVYALGIVLDASDLPPSRPQNVADSPDIDAIIEAARRRHP